jgi:DNA topoisomerase-6 subunit B
LLYDEGSDVAREVVSEVEINKMGISKKEVKVQFANPESRSDRAIELLPIHIFFHICSTKIPYKTAGKESIASEGDLKRNMKICLSELYRKVSAQIRKELRQKEAESRLHLYKYYIPLIVNAICESIKIDTNKLSEAFGKLAERHVRGEIIHGQVIRKEDKITENRIQEEINEKTEVKIRNQNVIEDDYHSATRKRSERSEPKKQASKKKIALKGRTGRGGEAGEQTTLDALDTSKKVSRG